MKILITGGSGFIAKNLFEQLNNEYDISSLDVKELDLFDSPKVFDYLKENKFDVIIHAATYDAAAKFSTKDPAKVLENNLKMFFNIVRCKDYFGKMIYFGSGAEFSRENWIPKMNEDSFDKHIRVKDLILPEGVKIELNSDEMIVSVIPPRSEEEIKATEEKPAEVVEPELVKKEKKEESEEQPKS